MILLLGIAMFLLFLFGLIVVTEGGELLALPYMAIWALALWWWLG